MRTSNDAAKTSTLRRLRELQKIINPGSFNEMNLGNLLQKTANYIFDLEAKVNVLRNLSRLYGV